jgi:hypothetical protein
MAGYISDCLETLTALIKDSEDESRIKAGAGEVSIDKGAS